MAYNPAVQLPLGTLVNVVAVLCGGSIGLVLRRGLPDKLRQAVFQAIGLVTLVIGMQLAIQTQNMLVLVFSVLLGGILGSAFELQGQLEQACEALKSRFPAGGERFTEGLVSAFLIFCVGSMTILGCMDEGLRGDPSILYTKSTLDGFMAAALASSFGVGVLFSVIPLFITQAGLTVLFAAFGGSVSTDVLVSLTATGGTLIVGIGLNLLELTRLRLVNFLPALLFAVLLALLAASVP
jgi:uncharacterized membrane protein YqgA involved in biofilm formation